MAHRLLDPVERTSEVLFGLIMVLTFTGTMSVAESGQGEIRGVLLGARRLQPRLGHRGRGDVPDGRCWHSVRAGC